jgi:hypothetical protein
VDTVLRNAEIDTLTPSLVGDIAKVRLSADAMRTEFVCIPRPITRIEKPDRGPLRYRVSHTAAPVEERRAPGTKNIRSRTATLAGRFDRVKGFASRGFTRRRLVPFLLVLPSDL